MLMSQHKLRLLLPLLLLITGFAGCRTEAALQLDLTDTCSGSFLYYCSMTNLTSSIEQPLVWITKSPAVHLNELIIYDSVLGRLPAVVFEIAPNLHTLIMHNCAVNNIMKADFEKASQLHKLVLQSNRLFNIPERVFAGMFALEELYLSHNTLHLVHRYAFARLQSLKYLDLQQNGIRQLPEGVFEDLINLEHIDLSSNELEVINTKTFVANNKLKTLLMSDNKFSTFEPNSLMHFDHLHILDLSNTLLEELQVQSVDLLMASGSKLKRCIISGSVVKLNAGNNALKSLTIHDKLAVRELDLHGNLIESLEGLVGMLNLQKLDISKNQLVSLKTSHSPMYLPFPNLVTLNLNSNHLQNLSAENFMLLLKLKSLDLAFNQLIRLDANIFRPLVNLEKLYLEGNRLFEFNYVQLKETHLYLHEVGIHENDWEFRYLKHMLNYFRNHGIRLPMRFTPAQTQSSASSSFHDSTDTIYTTANDKDVLNDMNYAHKCSPQANFMVGVTGIHPYWTTKDVIALITLIVVLLILLIQFLRILYEDNCLPIWCRNCFHRVNREEQPLQPRHRILEEDTSHV